MNRFLTPLLALLVASGAHADDRHTYRVDIARSNGDRTVVTLEASMRHKAWSRDDAFGATETVMIEPIGSTLEGHVVAKVLYTREIHGEEREERESMVLFSPGDPVPFYSAENRLVMSASLAPSHSRVLEHRANSDADGRPCSASPGTGKEVDAARAK